MVVVIESPNHNVWLDYLDFDAFTQLKSNYSGIALFRRSLFLLSREPHLGDSLLPFLLETVQRSSSYLGIASELQDLVAKNTSVALQNDTSWLETVRSRYDSELQAIFDLQGIPRTADSVENMILRSVNLATFYSKYGMHKESLVEYKKTLSRSAAHPMVSDIILSSLVESLWCADWDFMRVCLLQPVMTGYCQHYIVRVCKGILALHANDWKTAIVEFASVLDKTNILGRFDHDSENVMQSNYFQTLMERNSISSSFNQPVRNVDYLAHTIRTLDFDILHFSGTQKRPIIEPEIGFGQRRRCRIAHTNILGPESVLHGSSEESHMYFVKSQVRYGKDIACPVRKLSARHLYEERGRTEYPLHSYHAGIYLLVLIIATMSSDDLREFITINDGLQFFLAHQPNIQEIISSLYCQSDLKSAVALFKAILNRLEGDLFFSPFVPIMWTSFVKRVMQRLLESTATLPLITTQAILGINYDEAREITRELLSSGLLLGKLNEESRTFEAGFEEIKDSRKKAVLDPFDFPIISRLRNAALSRNGQE